MIKMANEIGAANNPSILKEAAEAMGSVSQRTNAIMADLIAAAKSVTGGGGNDTTFIVNGYTEQTGSGLYLRIPFNKDDVASAKNNANNQSIPLANISDGLLLWSGSTTATGGYAVSVTITLTANKEITLPDGNTGSFQVDPGSAEGALLLDRALQNFANVNQSLAQAEASKNKSRQQVSSITS